MEKIYQELRSIMQEKLRNHRDYTFGLSHVPCYGEKWSLHIFDKQTMWEVARL